MLCIDNLSFSCKTFGDPSGTNCCHQQCLSKIVLTELMLTPQCRLSQLHTDKMISEYNVFNSTTVFFANCFGQTTCDVPTKAQLQGFFHGRSYYRAPERVHTRPRSTFFCRATYWSVVFIIPKSGCLSDCRNPVNKKVPIESPYATSY